MRINIDIQVDDLESLKVEQLFIARANLAIIDGGYQGLKLPTPEWVTDRMGEVTAEITARVRAELTKRLKVAKARREGLKTVGERRTDADAEISELEAMLNQ